MTTMEHEEIEDRIREVELELVEIRTRLNKKHEELDSIHNEINNITECLNGVMNLTETINNTQKDMHDDLKDYRIKVEELTKDVITHSVQFEAYKDRQKGKQWQISSVIALVAIIVSVAVSLFLK